MVVMIRMVLMRAFGFRLLHACVVTLRITVPFAHIGITDLREAFQRITPFGARRGVFHRRPIVRRRMMVVVVIRTPHQNSLPGDIIRRSGHRGEVLRWHRGMMGDRAVILYHRR